MLYHLDAWLTRPPVPFVTAVPGFRYRSIPSERCAPLHGGVRRHEKSIQRSPVTLNLIQGLYRHPWLFTGWQERAKNPSNKARSP